MANYNILTEVPPISKQDSFVVFERRKSNFNFPIHIHSEYELNYIIGARGARRIVGDHVADIGDREMVLITGSNLEHAWMDGNLAPGAEIYEVTIQFSPELFQGSGLIDRKQFAPIKKMLQDAQHGIAFSEKTILQSESGIHQLINSTDNFNSILIFLSLLNQLAQLPPSRATLGDGGAGQHERTVVQPFHQAAYGIQLHRLPEQYPHQCGFPTADRRTGQHDRGDRLQMRVQQSIELQPDL